MSAFPAKHPATSMGMYQAREELANYVRNVIHEKRLSYRKVADRARRAGYKLSHTTVSEVVNGADTSFGIETLQAVACGLEVPEEEVINRARGAVKASPSEYRRRLTDQLYAEINQASPEKAQYLEWLIRSLLGQEKPDENRA